MKSSIPGRTGHLEAFCAFTTLPPWKIVQQCHPQPTKQKMFSHYYHPLTYHSATIYQLISLGSLHTEFQERTLFWPGQQHHRTNFHQPPTTHYQKCNPAHPGWILSHHPDNFTTRWRSPGLPVHGKICPIPWSLLNLGSKQSWVSEPFEGYQWFLTPGTWGVVEANTIRYRVPWWSNWVKSKTWGSNATAFPLL